MDEHNQPLPLNAFIIPEWGGISINSLDETEIFISQLGELLGVDSFSGFEFDNLLSKQTLDAIFEGLQTLNSLQSLLSQMTNIPVEPHVYQLVSSSLYHLKRSMINMNKQDYLESNQDARTGLKNAEQAFFDPTLVAMLYFPEDHKYAIYTPLFLPICVPMVFATLKLFKNK